ncbi:hypothetical protein [Pararhizobium sp. A13]|uniref:hypothetical protein n=1 Tax=Pararhizobium sp. A13 TaxID=3133975 RepID=UPI003253469A
MAQSRSGLASLAWIAGLGCTEIVARISPTDQQWVESTIAKRGQQRNYAMIPYRLILMRIVCNQDRGKVRDRKMPFNIRLRRPRKPIVGKG